MNGNSEVCCSTDFIIFKTPSNTRHQSHWPLTVHTESVIPSVNVNGWLDCHLTVYRFNK